MMNFNQTHKDIGEVLERVKVIIEFQANKELNIRHLQSSCGCSIPSYHTKEKKVKVNFMPNKVPIHLERDGIHSYDTIKNVIVTYKDGKQEVLSFKATIKKRR